MAWARQGEALWAGPPFAGALDLPSVRPESVRLEELRHRGRETLAWGLLELGRAADALDVLAPVIAVDPYRESAWALRVAALHQSGHQHDALAAVGEVRRLLGSELGIRPGRPLALLEQAILDQVPADEVRRHPGILPPPSDPGAQVGAPPPRPDPRSRADPVPASPPFVGRAPLLREIGDRAPRWAARSVRAAADLHDRRGALHDLDEARRLRALAGDLVSAPPG